MVESTLLGCIAMITWCLCTMKHNTTVKKILKQILETHVHKWVVKWRTWSQKGDQSWLAEFESRSGQIAWKVVFAPCPALYWTLMGRCKWNASRAVLPFTWHRQVLTAKAATWPTAQMWHAQNSYTTNDNLMICENEKYNWFQNVFIIT